MTRYAEYTGPYPGTIPDVGAVAPGRVVRLTSEVAEQAAFSRADMRELPGAEGQQRWQAQQDEAAEPEPEAPAAPQSTPEPDSHDQPDADQEHA